MYPTNRLLKGIVILDWICCAVYAIYLLHSSGLLNNHFIILIAWAVVACYGGPVTYITKSLVPLGYLIHEMTKREKVQAFRWFPLQLSSSIQRCQHQSYIHTYRGCCQGLSLRCSERSSRVDRAPPSSFWTAVVLQRINWSQVHAHHWWALYPLTQEMIEFWNFILSKRYFFFLYWVPCMTCTHEMWPRIKYLLLSFKFR